MLLAREGYEVVSAAGFSASLEKCKEGGFDLFVLGHSIPQKEKQRRLLFTNTKQRGIQPTRVH
jgi:hypothetical protein